MSYPANLSTAVSATTAPFFGGGFLERSGASSLNWAGSTYYSASLMISFMLKITKFWVPSFSAKSEAYVFLPEWALPKIHSFKEW